jgi:hypothetical protein
MATPRCGTCKKQLGPGVDKQRSTGKYWKNCKKCRDNHTSERRKAKGLPPKEEPPKFELPRKRPMKKPELEDYKVINFDTDANEPRPSNIKRTREKRSQSESLELEAGQHLRLKENIREPRTDLDATDDELDIFFDVREEVVDPSKGLPKEGSLSIKPPKKNGMFWGPEITKEKLAKKLPEKQRVLDTTDSISNLVAGEHLLLDPDANVHLRDPQGNGYAPYMALEKSEGTSGKSIGTLGNDGSIFPQYLPNPILESLGNSPLKQNLDKALPKESLDWNLDSDNDVEPDPLLSTKDDNTSVVEPDLPSELPKTTSTPEEPVTKDRECSVCAESFPIQAFPSLIACSHEPSVCHECFLAWLDQRMASTTWEQIVCPSSGCSTIVGHDDVKSYAPADVFTRYVHCSHDPITTY